MMMLLRNNNRKRRKKKKKKKRKTRTTTTLVSRNALPLRRTRIKTTETTSRERSERNVRFNSKTLRKLSSENYRKTIGKLSENYRKTIQ